MTYDAFTEDHDIPVPPPLPSPFGVNLGWENGWKEVPLLRQQCRKKKHILTVYRKGSTTRNVCEECEYYFQTDSSD